MNLQPYIEYLKGKENLSKLEKITLSALQDSAFVVEYSNLKFLENFPNLINVINNPAGYDSPENLYYQGTLVEISNTYRSYLYDSKGKYTNFKKEISEIQESIANANQHIENIKKVSDLVSGNEILAVYAIEFKDRAEAYQTKANTWQKWLIGSYVTIALLIVFTFFVGLTDTGAIHELQSKLSWEIKEHTQIAILAFKALILIGAIQLSRFFARNYNANMHLYQQTLHKYDVLKALQGVYNTLSNPEERDELIKTGAIIAFQNTESGFITVKEGAGNADAEGGLALLSSIIKK